MTASAKKTTKKKPVKAEVKKAVTAKAVKKPAPSKVAKAKPAAVKKPAPAKKAEVKKAEAKKPAVKKVEAKKPAAPAKKPVVAKASVKAKPVDAVKKPAAAKSEPVKKAAAKPAAVEWKNPRPNAKSVPMYETVPTSRETKAKREQERTLKPSERFNQSDLKDFEEQLLQLRARILSQSGTMKESALRGMDDVNPEEDGTDAHMRMVTLQQVGVQNQMLNKIEEALRAIAKGTYGICDSCGNLIRKQRLQAQPFSKTCIYCQSEMELGRIK